jgi:hypothetical protein
MSVIPSTVATTLGQKSKTVFLATEADKITFEATNGATALKKGMPVKLDTNGTLLPWVSSDGRKALVGYAYGDCAAGELMTVWSRGYAIIYGISDDAQNAGPVTYNGYDDSTDVGGTTGYSNYKNESDYSKINGWALDNADDSGELIRVLLMD